MAKLAFHSRIQEDHPYSHLEIRVLYSTNHRHQDDEVTFTWQSDPENRDWYGFTINLEAHTLESFERKVRMVRSALRGLELGFNTLPEIVLERLEATATEVVYDPRVTSFVKLDEVLPEEYSAWRDDWRSAGYCGATVGCMACNEENARVKLTQEFGKLLPSYEAKFLKWVEAGKPVRKLNDRCPDTRTAREKLEHFRERYD